MPHDKHRIFSGPVFLHHAGSIDKQSIPFNKGETLEYKEVVIHTQLRQFFGHEIFYRHEETNHNFSYFLLMEYPIQSDQM